MSAALESSDLLPKVPRLSLSEVPEVSAYFKNTLRAMFGEDEDKVRSYVQEITQTPWTPERMRERLAGIEDGEALKSAMRRLRRDNPNIERSIFNSIHSVNLDMMPGYKTGGVLHSFLENYARENR